MPKIFSESDRETIRQNLLKNGRAMLETKRCREISVAVIAAESGIAKGTFYNFFPSKELYFYEIMLLIRDENRKELLALAENPSYHALCETMYRRYTEVKTIYDYFEPEELNMIFRTLPDKEKESDDNSTELARQLISVCTDDERIKPEVVVNLMNIAASASANRRFLIDTHYCETISVLARAIADYIYGGNHYDA